MFAADDAQRAFAPYLAMLTEFAREHGMTLSFDPGGKSDPGYQLGWVNPLSETCFLYVHLLGPGRFSVHALRWNISSPVGRKQWAVEAGVAPAALRAILSQAAEWAQAPL